MTNDDRDVPTLATYLPGDLQTTLARLIAGRKAAAVNARDRPSGIDPELVDEVKADTEARASEVAQYEQVLTPEIVAIAKATVAMVEGCLFFGGENNAADLLWLGAQLATRRRYNWVRAVQMVVEWQPSSKRPELADWLAGRLGNIEPAGKRLDVSRIRTLLTNYGKAKGDRKPISSAEALAAHLAVECGAFGYTKFRSAKTAFAKALKS